VDVSGTAADSVVEATVATVTLTTLSPTSQRHSGCADDLLLACSDVLLGLASRHRAYLG
jgi:hypothetical protein